MEHWDVVVVGAGIGGLATAGLLARRGLRVVVLERAMVPGGRGRTRVEAGLPLNLGPHALYRAGAGMGVLRELGIQPRGVVPPLRGELLEAESGRLSPLPADPWSLLSTAALDAPSRWAVAQVLTRLRVGQLPHPGKTVSDWLAPLPGPAQQVLLASVRVSSYAHAPREQSALVAARQLRRAFAGVIYLEGGWSQLVQALMDPARGFELRCGAEVTGIEPEGVRLAGGEWVAATDVVLAVPPPTVRRLGIAVPDAPNVRAACLDLGLRRLPRPEHRFVLGLDRATYLSEHVGVVPAGERGVVVHVAKYLAPTEDGAGASSELEALLDFAQPGWREEVVTRRFAPGLVVSWVLDLPGHPRPDVSAGQHCYLVGDWVGGDDLLVDASLAAAAEVARRIRAGFAREAA